MLAPLTFAVAVAASFSPPQEPATPPTEPTAAKRPAERPAVAWQRTLADALAAQKATGLPLLVAVNMDGEVFNDRFAGDVYRDPTFVAKTTGYICVVASPDRHTERDYDALGNRIECPRFGGCTCSEHINIEPDLFKRYFDGNRNAPRHVGVSTDGKILFDRFLDQRMRTAIDAIEKNRGQQQPQHLAATDDLNELFRRRDAMARTLLERRYRKADQAGRARLLEAAAKAENEPIDLLRIGIRETDGKLCGLAALALGKVGGPEALIDIEDGLARIDDDDIRAALIEQLRRLAANNAQAARMASHFERSEIELPAPWRNAWAEAAFGDDRASIEAQLDRIEAALRSKPDDSRLRLQLGTAQAAYAFLLMREGGSGIDLWFADAQRNASKVKDESLGPETRALQAITSWYRSDGAAADKAAIAAMAAGRSHRKPDAWLAESFFDVLLQLTAQTAYGRAEQNANASLRGELARVKAVFALLEERNRGQERGQLAGIGLLEFAGLRAEARRRLRALASRFPGSVSVHERWRNRMLVDLGADSMRNAYARHVTDSQDRATAQWFAGYAALVAGDRHSQDTRLNEAENAYGDAIERLLESAQGNENYADSANHYAVLALAGRAAIRQQRNDLRGAVDDLVKANELRPASLDESDGLERKPRSIAGRIHAELKAKGLTELADRLQTILP